MMNSTKSEERIGRHGDFLQSSEIGLAKDNFYKHENRRYGGVVYLTALREGKEREVKNWHVQ